MTALVQPLADLARAGPALGFRLPRFQRLAWTSRAARAAWEPRLLAAEAASAARWPEAALAGEIDLALVRLAPFEAPRLRRTFAEAGRLLAVLGPDASAPLCDLLAAPRASGLWCLAGAALSVEAAAMEWKAGAVDALAARLGMPACCRAARDAEDPFRRPEWAALQGQGLTDWRTNHVLHRLGLAPAPWLPCRPDCAITLARFNGLRPPDDLEEILSWPLEWSALHGIAQVLTPVFRLVHDTTATGGKARHVRGDAARAPAETATGLVYPYKSPRRRPVDARQTFQDGVENAVLTTPGPAVGTVGRLPLPAFSVRHPEPVFVDGSTEGWPALAAWTEPYLAEAIGSAPAQLRDAAGRTVEAAFDRFLRDVLSGGPLADHYMLDFGFENFAPRLLADFRLPDAFDSWHERLPEVERPYLRTIYLGAAGTGSPLHFDLLRTSAWNAVVWGRKSWAFCPPGSELRLVANEPDLFDADTRSRLSRRGLDIRMCEQGPGELLFIPDGWWHQVRNEEPTLALTGNMLNAANAAAVQAFVAEFDGKLEPRLAVLARQLLKAIALVRPPAQQPSRARVSQAAPDEGGHEGPPPPVRPAVPVRS